MTTPKTQRSLIRYAIGMVVLTAILLWVAYQVRDVLLLLYISGLLAIGFSPIVRLIERQHLLPVGTRRFPRWLAILVLYVFIIGTFVGIGMMIFPPLFDQAQELWAQKEQMFEQGQRFLRDRGLLRGEAMTLEQAVERAPSAAGGKDAVATVFDRARG